MGSDQSDAPSFDEFFSQEFVPLVAFLRKAGVDREEARDAAAEAMTCAFQNWDRIVSPKAWARAAAWHIATRQVQRRRDALTRAVAGGWATTAHHDTDRVRSLDEYRQVLVLLGFLAPQQRLVMAWYLDGFDTSEIAECLGISTASVRSHLRFARQRLKQEILPSGESRAAVNE